MPLKMKGLGNIHWDFLEHINAVADGPCVNQESIRQNRAQPPLRREQCQINKGNRRRHDDGEAYPSRMKGFDDQSQRSRNEKYNPRTRYELRWRKASGADHN